jgi:hypothetical protein
MSAGKNLFFKFMSIKHCQAELVEASLNIESLIHQTASTSSA